VNREVVVYQYPRSELCLNRLQGTQAVPGRTEPGNEISNIARALQVRLDISRSRYSNSTGLFVDALPHPNKQKPPQPQVSVIHEVGWGS
jgi:hypothetical protein